MVRDAICFCGKAGERTLQQFFKAREDQAEPDRDQRDQRHPTDRVLRKVQQRQQRRADQGDQAEAQHQPGDHPIRPRHIAFGVDGYVPSDVPVVPEKKMTGNTGRMHGEMPVMRPPTRPINASDTMIIIRGRRRLGSVRAPEKR